MSSAFNLERVPSNSPPDSMESVPYDSFPNTFPVLRIPSLQLQIISPSKSPPTVTFSPSTLASTLPFFKISRDVHFIVPLTDPPTIRVPSASMLPSSLQVAEMIVVSTDLIGFLKSFSLLLCSLDFSFFFFRMVNPLLFRKRSGFQPYRISKLHAYSSLVLGSIEDRREADFTLHPLIHIFNSRKNTKPLVLEGSEVRSEIDLGLFQANFASEVVSVKSFDCR